jgi:hypothetical protein
MQPKSRSDPFKIDETFADTGGSAIPEYLETIALLQAEIVRLEQELQVGGDAPWETASTGFGSTEDEFRRSAVSETAAAAHAEAQRLTCELASSEQTVALLLHELSSLEEARTADRAEWEKLTEWVTELEQRVEVQDEHALGRLQVRLGDQQREAEELRTNLEQHRRDSEVQRQVYEAKIARLQEGLAQAQAFPRAVEEDDGQSSGSVIEVVKELREENLRLAARQEIAERTAAASSGALHTRLGEVQHERDEIRRQFEQVQDERRRERLEYEATLAECLVRRSQAARVQPAAPQDVEAPEDHPLEPDLRIRALRHHLLEIHQREEEERRQRSLTARLSRLWSRTSPR